MKTRQTHGRKKECSKCGNENDRPNQRYCTSCHTDYMNEFRAKKVSVDLDKLKGLVDVAAAYDCDSIFPDLIYFQNIIKKKTAKYERF